MKNILGPSYIATFQNVCFADVDCRFLQTIYREKQVFHLYRLQFDFQRRGSEPLRGCTSPRAGTTKQCKS